MSWGKNNNAPKINVNNDFFLASNKPSKPAKIWKNAAPYAVNKTNKNPYL